MIWAMGEMVDITYPMPVANSRSTVKNAGGSLNTAMLEHANNTPNLQSILRKVALPQSFSNRPS